MKDDVHFYKVEWEDCWLHQDVLSCWTELVETYKKSQELKIQVKQENGEFDYENQDLCMLCNLEPDSHSLPGLHSTKDHAAASPAQHISNLLSKKSSDQDYPFFLLSPNTFKLRPANTAKGTGESFIWKDSGAVKYACWHCGMKFKSFASYKLHQRTHDVKNGEQFICTTCKRRFTSVEALDKHRQLHTSSIHFTAAMEKASGDAELVCTTCRRCFTTQEALDKHTQQHVNLIRKFNATSLKKILSRSKKNFENHKTGSASMIHLFSKRDGTLAIPEDPGSADMSGHLHYPIEEGAGVEEEGAGVEEEGAGAGVSEFTPEVLQNARQYIKAVSRRRKEDTLRRIIESKTQEEPIKHSAHTIGVDVELNRSEESMPIVGKDGERYFYQCKLCTKKFYNKFHHREHFNVHSGEMPYQCEFCSKRFAQRSGWNRHIKLHHKYEVFEGPIPYSHTERNENPKSKRFMTTLKQTQENQLAVSLPTMVTNPLCVNPSVATTRYIPIAPYPNNVSMVQTIPSFPAGAIPLSPAILSPDRFPKNLENALPAGTVLFQAPPPHGTLAGTLPPKPIQILQSPHMACSQIPTMYVQPAQTLIAKPPEPQTIQVTNTFIPHTEPIIDPNLMNALSKAREGEGATVPRSDPSNTQFQCKKVKTMDGRVIFMVRVIDLTAESQATTTTSSTNTTTDTDREKKNTEFAYILDPVGQVEARIFVSDHPGGNWVDFPLDDVADGIMLDRIQSYDDKNRRGPKPRHYNNATLPSDAALKNVLDDEIRHGKELIEKALTNQNGAQMDAKKSQEESGSSQNDDNKTGKEKGVSLKVTHGRNFRSGKEKRFPCNVCSRKFLAQAHLNDHMLIHTGEFPYKCMFCSRPFRHKSGLNSHHKRHIQNGVFDRPISCKEPNKKRARLSLTVSNAGANPTTGGEASGQQSTTKSKRKGRPPKRKEAVPVVPEIDPAMFRIKEEDLEDGFMLDNEKRETVSFDVQDVFECNFCVLTFPTRTAYLKHVNTVHKNPVISPMNNGDPLSDGEDGSGDSRYIQMSDFENTLLDMGAEPQPSASPTDAAEKISSFVDGMIPVDQIKEETPDY